MNEAIKDIKKQINKDETLIIATSGGPDSMCLIDILNNLKGENNYKIICAHVNHKLRKESKKEAEMVKSYCLSNDIIFEYMEIENYSGNIENSARRQRYNFFEKLISKYNAKYLLTAHHGDDLIETIIMRISRGTKEYSGFSKITHRTNYVIYRPLIYITKEATLNYCHQNNLDYVIDKSNFDDKYTRNRIRKYVLPELKNENSKIHKSFLKFSETLKEYDEYINNSIKPILNKLYTNKSIDIKKFNHQPKFIKQKIIYKILEKEYQNNIYMIKERNINDIIKILESSNPNLSINLPLNKEFIKTYDNATIQEKKQPKPYNFTFKQEIILPNQHIIKQIDDTKENSNNILKINSKDIELPLHVRSRKNGDVIEIKGLDGKKKIKDIFINEKISKQERTSYPIVTDNNDVILWIPGLKKSKFDNSKTKNYDIIIKYF